ncbi:MAG TPA: dihydrolipoamide acetyltransferase family protein [Ktedonobacteraceae bacterium]|nr:dihydrolipoamide acetyltransferase family protein [Ktedonobacteraceae bacterium]
MKTVEMPKMGDSMEEGKILQWIKKEGEEVKKGEMLAEVETDKVNIEIEAFASGILRKILVPEGASALVGAEIALIGAQDEPLPDHLNANGAGFSGQAQATSARPSQSPSPQTQINQPYVVEPVQASVGLSTEPNIETPTAAQQGRIFISPLARRLADENHLDYANLRGTGPNKRIIKMDVEAAINRQQATATPAVSAQAEQITPFTAQPLPQPVPAAMDSGEVIEIPLTAMRRTIARRLSQSMQTAPHFYVTSVIDTDKLAAFRQQINEYAANDLAPIKISFNDLIVKAVAKALVRMPQVNVSFAEDRLLQKKQIHIGVAVALEQGLIVPVVRNVDQRGLLDIARETRRLADAAREGKLHPEEFSGGTFTVSNLGMFDVESFTAVINPPESAILAVGSITPTPVVVDGQVVVRSRMKVTLSSDHRAIDGAIAARFLQEVKRLLEEPFGLVL